MTPSAKPGRRVGPAARNRNPDMTNTQLAPPGVRASLGLLAGALLRVTGFCAIALLLAAPEVFRFS